MNNLPGDTPVKMSRIHPVGSKYHAGMTLIEVLTVITITLILVGAVIAVGKNLRQRADSDLAKSLLGVLDTALQQYYTDWNAFPFTTHLPNGAPVTDSNAAGLLDEFIGLYSIESGSIPADNRFQSDLALFYYLDKNPNSRMIVDAVNASLVTNRDNMGASIKIRLNADPLRVLDMPRYIDPWKTSIRYEYIDQTAFPVLTSAGPDKTFGTADDITNR